MIVGALYLYLLNIFIKMRTYQLNMIQYLFPSKKTQITQWQNIAALGVISYILYLYSIDDIISCNNVLLTYFASDILFAPPEAALHHTFCVMMMSCNLPYGYNEEDSKFILRPLIKTEVSTIFLLLKLLYEQTASDTIKQNKIVKTVSAINDVVFITTFMKTRMWNLTFDVMLNPEIYRINHKYLKDSIMRNLHFYVGFYGLYVINVYWTAIIFRKLFKDLVIQTRFAWINTQAMAERVLPWTLFLCMLPYMLPCMLPCMLPYVPYAYTSNNKLNTNTLCDLTGITILAMASYVYHAKKRDILNSGNKVLIANNIHVNGLNDDENVVNSEFLLNANAIHWKSILSVIAMDSNNCDRSYVLNFMGYLGSHYYSLYHLKIDETMTKHMNILNAFTTVPVIYDLVYIIAATDNRVIQTQIGIVAITMAAIIKVRPFYELNQILVHLLIVLQTWIVTNAIITK